MTSKKDKLGTAEDAVRALLEDTTDDNGHPKQEFADDHRLRSYRVGLLAALDALEGARHDLGEQAVVADRERLSVSHTDKQRARGESEARS